MRDAHSAPSKKSSMRITGKPSHCRVEACAVRGRAGLSNGARKVGAGEDMLGWECNQCAAWFFLGLRGLFLRKQLPLPASRASSPSPSTSTSTSTSPIIAYMVFIFPIKFSFILIKNTLIFIRCKTALYFFRP